MATPLEHTESIIKKVKKAKITEIDDTILWNEIYRINEIMDSIKMISPKYSARILTHQMDLVELAAQIAEKDIAWGDPTIIRFVGKEHIIEDYRNQLVELTDYFSDEKLEEIANDFEINQEVNRWLSRFKSYYKTKYRNENVKNKTIIEFFDSIYSWIMNENSKAKRILRTLLISDFSIQYVLSMLLFHNLRYNHNESMRYVNIRDLFLELNKNIKKPNKSILDIKQDNSFVKNGLPIKQ